MRTNQSINRKMRQNKYYLHHPNYWKCYYPTPSDAAGYAVSIHVTMEQSKEPLASIAAYRYEENFPSDIYNIWVKSTNVRKLGDKLVDIIQKISVKIKLSNGALDPDDLLKPYEEKDAVPYYSTI